MDTPAPAPRKSQWRWVRRIGLATTLVVVGLVAAAPTIISNNPKLRDHLVRRFMGDLNGDVEIKTLTVGWTIPLTIEGLALLPRADSQPVPGSSANREPLVSVARVESERSLWHMLWDRSDVGTIRIERPDVLVALGDKGQSNFAKVFQPILEREAKTPSSLKIGVRAQIVDGKLRGISAETREPWEITGVKLAVGVRAAEHAKSGKPELFVEKGTLVSRGELTVGLCNDVLKYIAPVMAKVARARGTISIELDDWRLPWKDFASGELGGRLLMNTVDVGPGVMTETILGQAATLPLVGDWMRNQRIPAFVNIAQDTVVTFKMVEGGRIQHEGLRFNLAELIDVQTHGTVGLDETLDLHASMGVHPPNPEERKLALLRQLSSQQWPVNIRGKLGDPQVDLSPIGNAWKQLLFQKVPADWLSGRNSVGGNLLGGITQKLIETGALPPETAGGILSQLAPPPGPPTPSGPIVHGAPQPMPPAPRHLEPSTGSGPALSPADGGTPSLANPSQVNTGPTDPTAALPPVPPPPTAAPIGPAPTGTAHTFGAADGIKIGLDVLSAIRAQRQQHQRPPLLPPPQGAVSPNGAGPQAYGPNGQPLGPDPAATIPPPRRPLLRQGLRAILDAATQPPPVTTPPTGTSPDSQPPTAQPPAAQPPAPANRAP